MRDRSGDFPFRAIIAFSQLATDAVPGTVPQNVLTSLILSYGSAMLVLAVISAWWLARFPITREEHEERVNRLAERRARDNRDAVTTTTDGLFLAADGVPAPHK